jgi:tetratricopeptide (TPR) repeat protein
MARVFYSNLLALLDRPEEAVEQGRRALESDPINPFIKGIYCLTLGNLGRYDEAIIQARSLLKASPDNPSAHSILWEGLHLKEELDEALEEAKAVYTHIGLASVVESMSVGHETGGYSGAVRAGAEALIALLPEGYSLPLDIANFYAMAGDKDRTVEWLEKGYEIRDPNMPYFGGEGIVKSLLRDDPRYQDLLRRMNLPVAGRK